MYLDEQDALRPASTKPNSSRAAWLGGGAMLLVVIAGGLVAALTAEDDEAPVATALEPEAPAVAPRSEGEIIPAAPTPSVAPALSPTPAAQPAPAAVAPVPNAIPKVPAVQAPTPATNPTPVARHSSGAVTGGSAEADLLQQLTERAGEFADTRKPAAPELNDAPPAPEPSRSPELADEPLEPAPRIVPELNDEPPLD